MFSIGQFAKLVNVSPRTVRYYESIGLIESASRGENNYRYYDRHWVDRVTKIKSLQDLGFSLDEIKDIFLISSEDFAQSLQNKIIEVERDLTALRGRHTKLRTLLSVTQKIDSKESINTTERKEYMEAIHEEILSKLKTKHGSVTDTQLEYLKRDRSFETAEQRDFIAALKRCLEFARHENLKLGPGRGSASASIVLYALGLSQYDPAEAGHFPERLLTQPPNIHIDVEFERGQMFVDFCRETTRNLRFGEIHAYKMPMLDILKNVDARLGTPVPYDRINENSDTVMSPFRNGDIEKIFHFDMSEDALIMKYENFLPGYAGSAKMIEYLNSQKIYNFRDVINILCLWRPSSARMVQRLEDYRLAKTQKFSYEFLSEELQASLKPNFGRVLYHEDLLKILAHYTGWNLERCNHLRRDFFINDRGGNTHTSSEFEEFKKLAPPEVVRLFLTENPTAFCLPHGMAHSYFTKASAILQNMHRKVYFEEIEKWEQKNGFRWDDIGVSWKGVSLLQN